MSTFLPPPSPIHLTRILFVSSPEHLRTRSAGIIQVYQVRDNRSIKQCSSPFSYVQCSYFFFYCIPSSLDCAKEEDVNIKTRILWNAAGCAKVFFFQYGWKGKNMQSRKFGRKLVSCLTHRWVVNVVSFRYVTKKAWTVFRAYITHSVFIPMQHREESMLNSET